MPTFCPSARLATLRISSQTTAAGWHVIGCGAGRTRNGADRSSRTSLKKNADGSVGFYVRATATKGLGENWILSVPGKACVAYFRLHGRGEAHFTA
jgi:hypothetical protein